MIIKNDDTLSQALALVELTPLRYSDERRYTIVTSAEELESLGRSALDRGSIAIVVPKGQEAHMESFTWELKMAKREAYQNEKRKVKEWVRNNPLRVARVAAKYTDKE